MKARYLRMTGAEDTKVSFGTFHAVFFQILKLAYGYRSENILREEEKYRFLREAVLKQKLEPTTRRSFYRPSPRRSAGEK